ncbi:unnamed protein product [Arabidopsis lyrata]|nr:unnamed protein product [Arabidopsis lyrata]
MSLSKIVVFCIILISLVNLHECNFFKDDKPLTNPITGRKTGKPPCKPQGDHFVCTGDEQLTTTTIAGCWRNCLIYN